MTRNYRQTPLRSCVVCRQKQDKRLMTRIVATPDGITCDPSGKMNGRGAYLCANTACWHRASESDVLASALRIQLARSDRDYLKQVISS